MGTISSNVGLISGLEITDLVDQLMQISAVPRDNLEARNAKIEAKQVAITTLASQLLSMQYDLSKLSGSTVFEAREVSSSNADVLLAALASSGQPSVGSFAVRTAQLASSQQLVSQSFDADAADLGSGTFSFGFGGFVDEGIDLSELNSGSGVSRGYIRITDRSGASADIDLTYATTVDDVLDAINRNSTISVTATATGDAFTLTDNSGGTGSLTVKEVGGGTTAADLGLAGISTASASATGSDVFTLHPGTRLTALNDGLGVQVVDSDELSDIEITLASGEQLEVDLSDADTLGDVIDAINALDTAKVEASISADGNRIELEDKTSGGESFSVVSIAGTAAEDLGIAQTTAGTTITGERLVSGLRDTLTSHINGGAGLGVLGSIDITDRDGGTDTVDLSSAETLQEIVDLINASTADVSAAINSERSGITVTDTSGGTGNLTIADADANNSATALGIVVDDTVASVDSGNLNRQTLSKATLLSSLNGGDGVDLGDIKITSSSGVTVAVDLNTLGSEARTIGDVIDAINTNATGTGISASINDSGDGIVITDTSGGSGNLTVADVNGDIAESLNLLRASTEDGGVQTIDGTARFEIDLSDLEGVSSDILLSTLNDGEGVIDGDILITDSAGNVSAFDFDSLGVTTIGDLVDVLNSEGVGKANITARINDAGSGIIIEDLAGGSETLTIEDVNGTTAANLNLTGAVTEVDGKQIVNGAGLFSAASDSQNVVELLAERVNDLDAGVTASVINDGTGYRLSLTVEKTGAGNELLVSLDGASISFEEVSEANDAVIIYGETAYAGSGILVTSSTNEFNDLIGGVDLTVESVSDTAVTVSVKKTDSKFVSAVEDLVDAYNSLRGYLDEYTDYDEDTETAGVLIGSSETLRIDTDLSRVLSDRFYGLGSISSLEELGLSLDSDGMLELDKSKLKEVFAESPEAVKRFFTDETSGFVAVFDAAIERLAGEENSTLTTRLDALTDTIESNEAEIEEMGKRLDVERDRLLLEFYNLETMLSTLQSNLDVLDALSPIEPLTVSRSRANR